MRHPPSEHVRSLKRVPGYLLHRSHGFLGSGHAKGRNGHSTTHRTTGRGRKEGGRGARRDNSPLESAATSVSPFSRAQQFRTGLCCPNYPSCSRLFSIPPACPSSSYSLETRLHCQAVHAQRAKQGLRWSRLCSVPQCPLGSFADNAELLHLL